MVAIPCGLIPVLRSRKEILPPQYIGLFAALYAVEHFVVDQQNLLLDEWLNQPHQAFYSTLQGWLQAFRALYNEEARENDILEMAISKSPKTSKIIRFLYQHGQPICHGDLADALGMSYSALTNAMKRVIACGAVSASRTDRNTRYILTSAAKQYCKKETTWKTALSDSIIQTIKELMKLLELQGSLDG